MKTRVWVMDKNGVVDWRYYEDIDFLEFVREINSNYNGNIKITYDQYDDDIVIEVFF